MRRDRSKLPKSYAINKGCHNCVNAFRLDEYDGGPQYYCKFEDITPRPICGSVLMTKENGYENDERFTHIFDDVVYEEQLDAWDNWSEGREVDESGICDNWVLEDVLL